MLLDVLIRLFLQKNLKIFVKKILCYLFSKTFYDLHNFFIFRGKRIHFEQLGVASKPLPGYDTLANLMAKNGHQHITYLKV